MDAELFRSILVGLLALGMILLAAVLATLSAIRKTLEAGSAPGSDLGLGSQPQQSGHVQLPSDASTAAESAPAAQTAVTGGQASSIRGVLQQHGLQGAQASATAAQEPAAQEQVSDSAFAAHADDPQEEPFQRDGRWWFRRADELLLYDEATGQWQPAPEGTPGTATPTAGAAATQTQPVATGMTEGTPALADAVANYWKCPTCAAVNGSTAATCRMCFAARP